MYAVIDAYTRYYSHCVERRMNGKCRKTNAIVKVEEGEKNENNNNFTIVANMGRSATKTHFEHCSLRRHVYITGTVNNFMKQSAKCRTIYLFKECERKENV